MKTSSLTRGEFERNLSQDILRFYAQRLGHTPEKVSCEICDDKVVVVIDDSITTAEQILMEEGEDSLAQKVRSTLDEAIQEPLKELIESSIGIKVVDFFSDATLETTRTGIIAVLSNPPSFRKNNCSKKGNSATASNGNGKAP